jgi:hypothetical protein
MFEGVNSIDLAPAGGGLWWADVDTLMNLRFS